jgi:hypothetical protein
MALLGVGPLQPPVAWWRRQVGVVVLLALFVAALYYPLLFTDRVLASGDILLYVYPYRDYAANTLAAGRIPLWNPYIFMGAPFLANPQAAVLYPLHWPLIWLPVTKQVYWSAAIHSWLLGLGGYGLLRGWGLPTSAALLTGVILAGSGFYGGLIGHLNQMNAAAWLPWALLLLEYGIRNTGYGIRITNYQLRVTLCMALLVAMMLLAGHTQTAYINLFALGAWVIWRLFFWLSFSSPSPTAHTPHSRVLSLLSLVSTLPSLFSPLPLLIPLIAGGLLGVLLSAAQLLPTLELSQLGLRSGGLSYAEATSFSLKPLHLLWTLLPSYGLVDLGAVFGTPAFTEYMAYVGLIGLALATLGAWRGRGAPRQVGLFLVVLGFLLALGRWNPLYFILYWVLPGFDLFRNPARWMMLYTLGMAILAGLGADYLWQTLRPHTQAGDQSSIVRRLSSVSTLHSPLLLLLTGLELFFAARALPYTQSTAPQAVYDVRTAVAHLLTDPERLRIGSAAMGRFLGMSTITYDPGDMADWRRILLERPPAQLDQRGFDQLIIALKVQELIAPNLSLLWRVPTVDGFDGGVLPLNRYNEFLTLLAPRETLWPDGRLREQLYEAPPTSLLNLLNVQYLVTDKVRDLWFEDVFYDRQIGVRLGPAGPQQVEIAIPRPFVTTHVDLITAIDGEAATLRQLARENKPVAHVVIHTAKLGDSFQLTAGGQPGAHLADSALESPLATHSGATVAHRDVQGGRQEYRVRLPLSQPATLQALFVSRSVTPFTVTVQAVTLLDARTGMFTPLLPSDRGRFQLVHSGDVKIYENLDRLPRAYLAHRVIGTQNLAEALDILRAGRVVSDSAVVEGLPSFATQPHPTDHTEIMAYAAEAVEVRTSTQEEALLILSDTFYPGWRATVDGAATPIYATNYLFRGVVVPPGEHTVRFVYQPDSWQRGLWLSGLGGVVVLGLIVGKHTLIHRPGVRARFHYRW